MKTTEELAELICNLSQQLAAAAENGDRTSFYESMAAREQAIDEIESHMAISGDEQRTQQLLVQARAINEQLQSSLTLEQQKLLDLRSELKRGENMKKAYGQNQ